MARIIPFEVINFLGRKEKIDVFHKKFSKNTDNIEDLGDATTNIITEVIQPYYKNINKDVNIGIYKVLIEPLKNANYYSNNLDKIVFGLMMSKKALITSYNDGGSYFKRQDVKECYENRIRHPETTHIRGKGIDHGMGTLIIYNFSDFIYVDTSKGTLYTGFSVGNTNSNIFQY